VHESEDRAIVLHKRGVFRPVGLRPEEGQLLPGRQARKWDSVPAFFVPEWELAEEKTQILVVLAGVTPQE